MRAEKGAQGVIVDRLREGGGRLWLALLILSPLVCALFAAFAVLYAGDGAVVIIGCCAASIVALILFCACIASAKRHTARWHADGEGISYSSLGRRRVHLRWEEVREAGFLLAGGETRAERLQLYWSAHELRGRLKGGKIAGRAEALGGNVRGADMIVYPVPAFGSEEGAVTYDGEDALIAFTRAHMKKPLRHEELLTPHSSEGRPA